MSAEATSGRPRLAPLVGDACLFTAAILCLMVWGPLPMALVIGPAAAWYLHGVPLDRRALIGGACGLPAASVAAGAMLVLAPRVLRGPASADTPGDLAGAAMALAVVAGAFALVVLALAALAVRDLTPSRRLHPRLDVARLAAAGVVVLFAVVVAAIQYRWPGSEVGDAGVFLLAGAFVGALTMLVAEPARRRLAPPAPSSAPGQEEEAGASTESAQR